MTTLRRRQWIVTAVLVLAAAGLWLIPSNLEYCVVEKRPILLWRYSVDWLSGLLALMLIVPPALYLTWASDAKERRLRVFRLIAATVSILLAVAVLDVALRFMGKSNYVQAGNLYHRPPGQVYKTLEKDAPGPGFAYAYTAEGYPEFEATLTTDANGFRNKSVPTQADILAIGDSFVEGSHVSDEHVWPVLLASKTDKTVYNLGMSGSRPRLYLETLRKYGAAMKPKVVLVMLYEGNDFRDQNAREGSKSVSLTKRIKASPLRRIVRENLIEGLSFPASAETIADLPAISWLPLSLPAGSEAKRYTFDLDRLQMHWRPAEEFEESVGCKHTFEVLRQLKQACVELNARLVVVFAPDTPHVMMPPLAGTLSAGQVRAFMAIKEKDLPPQDKFLDVLMERLGTMENAMRDFCAKESIDFYSPTQALQQRSMQGVQTYFTYDQHWSPAGHVVVAEGLARFLAAPAGTTARGSGAAPSRTASQP